MTSRARRWRGVARRVATAATSLHELPFEVTRRLSVKRVRREGTLPDAEPVELGPVGLPCSSLTFRSEVLPDGRAMVALEGAIPCRVDERRAIARRWEEAPRGTRDQLPGGSD